MANAPPAAPSCSRSLGAKPRPKPKRCLKQRPRRRFHPLNPDLPPMPQQLAYVIITPYSLHKSRTVGILARLISRTSLEMVGASMFPPSPELVTDYLEVIVSAN